MLSNLTSNHWLYKNHLTSTGLVAVQRGPKWIRLRLPIYLRVAPILILAEGTSTESHMPFFWLQVMLAPMSLARDPGTQKLSHDPSSS